MSEEERKNYKIDFWHLFSRYERAASYFQVFLFSETHKKDVKQMEDLFKESVLIKYILNAQKENDDAEKRYTLLKELLAAKGEGYDKLKLPDEQIEGIINKYFPNSHINSGDYFSLLKKQQKENP